MKKLTVFIFIAFATTYSFSQCACCAGSGIGSSNGDYNNGILTLPKKHWVAETYADYRTIKNGNAPEADEKLLRSIFVTSAGLRYGISNKLTVSALLPYVHLHTSFGNDNGLGDMIVLGTLNIYSKNNLNVAVQAGAELPTGIQKNSNFDNTTVVVGSGSVDPMAGILFSKQWSKLSLQGNGLFKYTTPGFQKNEYGSVSTHSLSLAYRIKSGSRFCSIDSSATTSKPALGWNVFGGYYGEWLGRLKEDNVTDENSGYYAGFATLGTAISYKTWSVPVTVSLPIIIKMNGEQNDAGYRLRVGLIKSFQQPDVHSKMLYKKAPGFTPGATDV